MVATTTSSPGAAKSAGQQTASKTKPLHFAETYLQHEPFSLSSSLGREIYERIACVHGAR